MNATQNDFLRHLRSVMAFRALSASVQVRSVRKQADGSDLATWVEGIMRPGANHNIELAKLKQLFPASVDVPVKVTTGEDGRFRLIGFGRERLLEVLIRRPTIVTTFCFVLTRKGPDNGWIRGNFGLYGCRLDVAAAPCKPIVGTVRDKRSGKPLAGITVAMLSFTWAETDNQGRYRLDGVAKSPEYEIAAGAMPHFNCSKQHILDRPGLEPLTVDFELERGIVVKGRLIDKASRKPVSGRILVKCRASNCADNQIQGIGAAGEIHADFVGSVRGGSDDSWASVDGWADGAAHSAGQRATGSDAATALALLS